MEMFANDLVHEPLQLLCQMSNGLSYPPGNQHSCTCQTCQLRGISHLHVQQEHVARCFLNDSFKGLSISLSSGLFHVSYVSCSCCRNPYLFWPLFCGLCHFSNSRFPKENGVLAWQTWNLQTSKIRCSPETGNRKWSNWQHQYPTPCGTSLRSFVVHHLSSTALPSCTRPRRNLHLGMKKSGETLNLEC